jgi:hypothetical protein
MADHDPGELTERLEAEADALERHSRRLGQEVERARQDWERKRADRNVPGASPRQTGGDEPEAQFPAKAESAQEDED